MEKSLMELDRPHYRTNSSTNSTNSELFICFASRLSSSSSMKISKSILSPGRGRDPPVSLSTSLSRRLRSNGSMKGGQASPMFPTGGKKRGCAFENPEPSSPKVTCIGQVRVKTKKKKAKQTRSLSRRRSGEVSFRKVEQQAHDVLSSSEENVHGRGQRYPPSNSSTHFQQPGECMPPHRNQRWVHLPVTICEALRTFGAEFSCLFPCRSSCFSTHQREKEEKVNNAAVAASRREEEEIRNGESSCGAVFARWFVALQDCEGRQGRQIELVVGGEDDERTERASMRSSRRHVFEDIEIKDDDTIEVKGEEEEKARLSICIPPKNALLLMRCRSDPMKMANLTNRFWESPAPQHHDHDHEDEDDDEDEEEEEGEDLDDENSRDHFQYPEVKNETTEEVEADDLASERRVSTGCAEKDANLGTGMQDNEEDQKLGEMLHNAVEVEIEDMQIMKQHGSSKDDESELKFCSVEVPADREVAEHREDKEMKEEEEEESSSTSHSSSSGNSEKQNLESDATEKETLESCPSVTGIEWDKVEESTAEERKDSEENNEEKETTTHQNIELQDTENYHEEAAFAPDAEDDHEIRNSQVLAENQEKTMVVETTRNDQESLATSSSSKVLPDCLLLMMCEPKLSMEVSKETWVCSTDFIRWLPERHAKKVNPTEEPKKRVAAVSTDSNAGHQATENKTQKPKTRQQLLQPPRSSCSLPAAAAASMATMIEQKLVNAVGYEPFVLTRCKSEPMRTAAAKLAPDSCFWNNRKLEPHRPATFGVGAAGVGF